MLSRFSSADSAGGLFDALASYMQSGGFVMPPLVVVTVVLWFAIDLRAPTYRELATRRSELARRMPAAMQITSGSARSDGSGPGMPHLAMRGS